MAAATLRGHRAIATSMLRKNNAFASLIRRGKSAAAPISSRRRDAGSYTSPLAVRRANDNAYYNEESSRDYGRSSRSIGIPTIIVVASERRHASSISSRALSSEADDDRGRSPTTTSSSSELHSIYHDQMKEIQLEREAVFGVSDDDGDDGPDLTRTAKAYLSPESNVARPSSSPPPSPSDVANPRSPPLPSSEWNVEEAYAEREELYAFSEGERNAWSNSVAGDAAGTTTTNYDAIRRARESRSRNDDRMRTTTSPPPPDATSSSPFSHLTPRGDGVSMVDVGGKVASRRVALARSVVVFPPEVLSAFRVNGESTEMIGPKGPIFETAKIAGIMGAKKTSDIIPLCHPLPLDRVNIEIHLANDRAIVECECSVTHRTGVEMEALTGASVAALTIYDMVKAVSHRVEIGRTVLVSKSGGKSDFVGG